MNNNFIYMKFYPEKSAQIHKLSPCHKFTVHVDRPVPYVVEKPAPYPVKVPVDR